MTALATESLRCGRLPALPIRQGVVADILRAWEASSINRRQFLTLGGLAGASAIAALEALPEPFEIVGDERRLSFLVAGREAWVIDPKRFAGPARLHVRRTADHVALRLKGARYPGTTLSADLACYIRREALQWRMDLRLAAGGMRTRVAFVPWLLGNRPAVGLLKRPAIATLGQNGTLSASVNVQAEFQPCWVLRLLGGPVGSIRVADETLESDALELGLPPPADFVSLLSNPPPNRTIVVLKRGKAAWKLRAPTTNPAQTWRVTIDDGAFDRIRMDTGEDAARGVRSALVAESVGDACVADFEPTDDVTDVYGQPCAVRLRRLRYAMAATPQSTETFLVGEHEGVWLHREGLAVELGAGRDTSPLELHTIDGKSTLRFTPPVVGLSAALAPGTASSFDIGEGTLLDLSWSPTAGKEPYPTELSAPAHLTVPLDKVRLNVTRPSDLLRLSFEFTNLTLTSHHGKPYLERTKEGTRDPEIQPAYIRVVFPGQHVAEEAFFQGGYPVTVPLDTELYSDSAQRDAAARRRDPDFGKDTTGTQPLKTPPVQARLAGASRLVFKVPAEVPRLPLRLETLLDWDSLDIQVSERARVEIGDTPVQTQIQEAGENETQLELPYRLMISPNAHAGWAHAVEPVDQGKNRTELWQTRLGVRDASSHRVDLTVKSHRTVRAVWSPDFAPLDASQPVQPTHKIDPYRMSLDRQDRNEIVHLSSNYLIKKWDGKAFIPLPIDVEDLRLSALGAWLRSRGSWDPPVLGCDSTVSALTVEEWRHIAAMARDQYVRVVYKGYLLPFGHRASLIKVTERRFEETPEKDIAAYLRQEMFIIVREPRKRYPAVGQPWSGRQLGFKEIELLTLTTPPIDDPQYAPSLVPGTDPYTAFVPHVGGQPFWFAYRTTDANSDRHDRAARLLFVDNNVAHQDWNEAATPLAKTLAYYNAQSPDDLRRDGISRQRIALAPSKSPGDTSFHTDSLVFKVDPPMICEPAGASGPLQCGKAAGPCSAGNHTLATELRKADQPPFYPAIDEAYIHLDAVQQVSGQMSKPIRVSIDPTYCAAGFSAEHNRGEVFLSFKDRVPMTFGGGTPNADRSGGVITPNVMLVGVSRRLGPVGGGGSPAAAPAGMKQLHLAADGGSEGDALARIKEGRFDALDFFGGALSEARILGGIKLWDIVRPLAAGALENLGDAPKMVTEFLYEAGDAILLVNETIVRTLQAALEKPALALLRARLGPKVASVAEHVGVLRAALANNPADVAAVASTPAAIVGQVKGVLDELRRLVENPALLAEDALALLTGALAPRLAPIVESIAPAAATVQALSAQLDARVGMAQAAIEEYRLRLEEYRRNREAEADKGARELLADIEVVDQLRGELAQVVAQLKSELTHADEVAGALKDLLGKADWGPLLRVAPYQVQLLQSIEGLFVHVARIADLAATNATASVRQRLSAAFSNFPTFDPSKVIGELEAALAAIRATPEYAAAIGTEMARRVEAAADLVRRDLRALSAYLPTPETVAAIATVGKTTLVLSSLGTPATPNVGRRGARAFLAVQTSFVRSLEELRRSLEDLGPSVAAKITLALVKDWIPRVTSVAIPLDDLKAAATDAGVVIRQRIDEGIIDAAAAATALTQAADVPRYFTAARSLIEAADRVRDPIDVAAVILDPTTGIAALLPADKRQALRDLQETVHSVRSLAQEYATRVASVKQVLADLEAALPALVREATQLVMNEVTGRIAELESAVAAGLAERLLPLARAVVTAIDELLRTALEQAAAPLQTLGDLASAVEEVRRLAESLIPTHVTVRYDWNPTIKSFPDHDPIFEVENDSRLAVKARIDVPLRGGAPTSEVSGSLTKFGINLIANPNFITVKFDRFEFKSSNGSKPTCDVKIGSVVLSEELSFVRKLQTLFSPSDGPFIELGTSRVLAGYRFAVPAITFGAFNLRDLRLAVVVNLPFSGEPVRLRLAVSDRAHPFLLSSGIFGGGGFFGLALGLDGVEVLEGALEMGVTAAIEIGPARGSGYVMVGIYFRVAGSRSEVCGYVRAGGELDILGLITMSIDVHVSLCYRDGGVEGRATITVHFHIVFVDFSVNLEAHYRFGGSTDAASRGGWLPPASDQLRIAANLSPDRLAALALPAAGQTGRPPRLGRAYKDLSDYKTFVRYRAKFAR